MILFQNIDVYAPEYLGRKDVLTVYDKIVKIADAGTITADGLLSGAETVDGTGLVLTPGFVDCHVHVLGGGGEGGFANRTPEATMEGLNKFGVTTVVGCLGTDGIGRDMSRARGKNKRPPGAGHVRLVLHRQLSGSGAYTDGWNYERYHDDRRNHRNRRNRHLGPPILTADLRRIRPTGSRHAPRRCSFRESGSDQCPPWRRCKMYGADRTRHQRNRNPGQPVPPDPCQPEREAVPEGN